MLRHARTVTRRVRSSGLVRGLSKKVRSRCANWVEVGLGLGLGFGLGLGLGLGLGVRVRVRVRVRV